MLKILNSTKCWICDNAYVDNDVKERNPCHWKKKRVSADRYCNIKVKSNHKIPVIIHSLKDYDSHLTMQGLGKFNFKINDKPNGMEKYTRFNISNKLAFIHSF